MDEDVETALCIIAFFLGIALIVWGILDLNVAYSIDDIVADPTILLTLLRAGSISATKIAVGIILSVAVISGKSLKVSVSKKL